MTQQFIGLVKASRIEGLEIRDYTEYGFLFLEHRSPCVAKWDTPRGAMKLYQAGDGDMISAHLRRWIESKGHGVCVCSGPDDEDNSVMILPHGDMTASSFPPEIFKEGKTELERIEAAVVWVCEQDGE